MDDGLTREIRRVNAASRMLVEEYSELRGKMSVGEVHYSMYSDIFEFVNLRVETATSCLLLIEQDRIADTLGLSRSLLEHYLLLILMCRGRKFFQLEDLSSLSESEFKKRLRERQDEITAAAQKEGKPHFTEARKYPRRKKNIMYIAEGLRSPDDPNFLIPWHYFQFQNFRPEAMRLKNENYFEYYELPSEVKSTRDGYRLELESNYRHYLSYDALLQCLAINDLVDQSVIARIEAHYTFLGTFLHPTRDAVRNLQENSNFYSTSTGIGTEHPYTKVAILLSSLYVCYLLAGLFDEVAALLDRAPAKYIADAGTTDIRPMIEQVPREFSYFWFLFNRPPLYDRFNYCVYHTTDEELREWGGYGNVPDERVPFNQHIYDNLMQALKGWSNMRCGAYRSPITR